MASFILLLVLSCLPSLLALPLEKRDDNIPARVPYIFPEAGTDSLADSIRARRTNGVLLDLDGVLLNSRPIAAGWNAAFDVIRNNNSLPGDMRELLILRTAVVNNAAYEWIQHEPVGRAEGLTTEQLLFVRLTPPFGSVNSSTITQSLGPHLSAAMIYADEVALNIRVSEETFNSLRVFLNDTQLVDAAATAGGYNWVSRFTVGLDIDGKANVPVPIPQG
ncbi:AhpD-like protein [Armillaria luteobubalina]|uniref:AhpD-like protein n=1 Tax=Armillaria luteobubalina TaxID=153913 RepID=A0AA39QNF3_9AGAR|nr:AhpD-like protein [Armillaria luteobubalina]